MPQLTGGKRRRPGSERRADRVKDEGEQEEKRNVSAGRDLDDVKSSLVNESETNNSSSDSEFESLHLQGGAGPLPQSPPGFYSSPDGTNQTLIQKRPFVSSSIFGGEALRRRQDAGLFQPSPYVGYPFFMIPDLGNFCSPYLANGALTPSARTSNNVPVVQHPHMSHLHRAACPTARRPSSPQRPLPAFSPDTGMSRTPHTACYPVLSWRHGSDHTPSRMAGQSMYPLAGGFSPAALAMNASMSSLVSGSFSPRLVPTPQSSIPHPAIVPTGVKQEPGGSNQPGKSMADVQQEKEDAKKPHIKKPLNAFMLYMREERPKVVAQCKVKESATINQILGQRWHSLTKEEQAKYYELARKERLLHSKLYPGWSARDNYGKKKKRKRTKSETQLEEDLPPQLKRPRVPPEETPHTHSLLTQTAHTHARSHLTQPHSISHLTHTHLSQASPASSLDSPATPTTALASPAAPAPTHTEHTHYSYGGHTSPYGEQLQPLSLTTKPHRTPHPLSRNTVTPGPSTPSSSCDTPTSSPLMASSRCSPPPPPLQPFLVPPLSSAHQSAASSHGALTQSQPFSLRRANQL
ncbi:Transcription factor 7-like 1-A [Nibea albiflora]|uniref:Transcription factor 7-like 1-A n=1 Tax=Nibea albiflora TaxID=240163 RepID=A0ACB7F8B5_NIBAL|nr:Transcription factor 7-like 1-A [Nibea albiflora]